MIALFIILGVTLFFVFLFTIPLSIRLDFQDSFRAQLRILIFRFSLYPRKRSPRAILKAQNKQEKRLIKERKKKEKPIVKKEEPHKVDRKPKKSFTEILALVRMFARILRQISRRFPRYFRITLRRCILKVGGNDAADTAVKYGAARAGISYLVTVMDHYFTVKTPKNSSLRIEPDFVYGESSFELSMTLSTTLRALAALAIRTLLAYLRRPKPERSESDSQGASVHS